MNDPQDREVRTYATQEGDPTAYCPICRKELLPGDQLVAYYYAPKNWWVVDHYTSRSESPGEKYCGVAVTSANGTNALWRVKND